ncbi:MAG: hypothetical protein HY584_03775 [Candidatus Omnitrophica bacterium]|nr:hypothetical protein [Candidatus Omnitrophota bacterium]
MKPTERILWAVGIVLVDFFAFAVPLTAFVAAYILIVRPIWFKDFVSKLYGTS